MEFLWVGFCEDVVAHKKNALITGEEAITEPAHLMKRYIATSVQDKGFAHIPKIPHLPLIGVVAVYLELTNRNRVALRRPGFAVIIAILENKIPLAVNTGAPAILIGRAVRFYLA